MHNGDRGLRRRGGLCASPFLFEVYGSTGMFFQNVFAASHVLSFFTPIYATKNQNMSFAAIKYALILYNTGRIVLQAIRQAFEWFQPAAVVQNLRLTRSEFARKCTGDAYQSVDGWVGSVQVQKTSQALLASRWAAGMF